MTTWDTTVDLVIIGSGGGGMVAALTAADAGASALVLEKQERVGGSTCMSGGILWVPNNPVMRAEGVADSYEDAMAHFEAVVGDVGPASSFERRHAFLTAGPEMVSFLQECGVRFAFCPGYSDYYSSAKGGHRHRARHRTRAVRRPCARRMARQAPTRACAEPRPRGDDERSTLALALQPQHRGVHGLGPRGAPDLCRSASTPGVADERRITHRADAAHRHRPWHTGLDGGAARRPDRRGRAAWSACAPFETAFPCSSAPAREWCWPPAASPTTPRCVSNSGAINRTGRGGRSRTPATPVR